MRHVVFLIIFLILPSIGWSAARLPQRVVDSEYVIGNPKAEATIYEYGALTCHVCLDFYLNVLPKLLQDKDFAGKIRIVIRPFPFSKLDVDGARIVLYSKDPHGLTKKLYETHEEWLKAPDQLEAIKKVAEKFGMSRDDIEASLQDKHLENAMLARRLIFKSDAAPIFKVGSSILPGLPHFEPFALVLKAFLDYRLQGHPEKEFDALKEFERLAKEREKKEREQEKTNDKK